MLFKKVLFNDFESMLLQKLVIVTQVIPQAWSLVHMILYNVLVLVKRILYPNLKIYNFQKKSFVIYVTELTLDSTTSVPKSVLCLFGG